MTTDLSAQDRTWSRLRRVTGTVGLAAIVLVFASAMWLWMLITCLLLLRRASR